jgi:hypothetical protein|tara:strand:+ start:262 stop:381 length:120 start_codon:yes stop_codon:yes gene_type:complete
MDEFTRSFLALVAGMMLLALGISAGFIVGTVFLVKWVLF